MKKVRRNAHISGEIFRFGVTGSLGFIVDAVLVTLLYQGLGFHPITARAIAICVAVVVTLTMNRHWTFEHGSAGYIQYQAVSYVFVQGISITLNFVIYVWLIDRWEFWQRFPFLAVAIGSTVAMIVTFSFSKWIVFRMGPRAK